MRSVSAVLLVGIGLAVFLSSCSSSPPTTIVKPTPGWGRGNPCPRGYRCESFSFDVCEENGQDIPVLPHGGLARCDPATETKFIPGSYNFTVLGQPLYNGSRVWDFGTPLCPAGSLDIDVRIACFTRDNGGARTGYLIEVVRVRVAGRSHGRHFHRAYHIDVKVDVHGGITLAAVADTATPYEYRPGHCLAGYRCKPVRERVCSSHSSDSSASARWTLRPVPFGRCNEYIFDVSLVAAYNGKRVKIVPHSMICPVRVAHIHMRVRCTTESQFAGGNFALGIVHVYARAPRYGYEAVLEIQVNTHGRISAHAIVP